MDEPGVFRSVDMGKSWQRMTGLPLLDSYTLAVCRLDAKTTRLFVGGSGLWFTDLAKPIYVYLPVVMK